MGLKTKELIGKERSVRAMGMKISILYLGKMEFPKFRLVDWKDEGAMVQSPAVAILIQHPTLGNILYDTGNCEDFSAVYRDDLHSGGAGPKGADPG